MGEGGRPAETANENLSCRQRTGPRREGFYTDAARERLGLGDGIGRVDSAANPDNGLRYNAEQFLAGMKHRNDHEQGAGWQSGL